MKESFLKLEQSLVSLVNQETGEILEGYEEISIKREDKLTGIAKYVLYSESQIKAMKEHIETVTERMKTAKKKLENTKEFIKVKMEHYGLTRIECPQLVVSIPKPRTSMVGSDNKLREQYNIPELEEGLQRAKTSMAEEKKEIKEYLKTGSHEDYHLEYNTKLNIK